MSLVYNWGLMFPNGCLTEKKAGKVIVSEFGVFNAIRDTNGPEKAITLKVPSFDSNQNVQLAKGQIGDTTYCVYFID